MLRTCLPTCAGLIAALLTVPSPAADPLPTAPVPSAPAATGDKTRGFVKYQQPGTGSIGRQRAVIVGLNYAGRDETKLGKLSVLANAERDAQAVANILANAFGYRPAHKAFGLNVFDPKAGDIRVITGAEATRRELGRVLLNPDLGFDDDPIKETDSVLVYFSGHGTLRSEGRAATGAEQNRGLILPFDVAIKPDGAVRDVDLAIDLQAVVEALKGCKAKHKLLVLDCCHSGAVFHLPAGQPAGRSAVRSGDGSVDQPSFQVMTATRSYQTASDGSLGDGNSPYTINLLRAMTTLGIRHGSGQFTAGELFDEMRKYLGNLPDCQSPEFRSLDNGDGEYHFFVSAGARFPGPAELTAEQRRVLMALTPSTFGYWWADEMPWFMPCLRLDILSPQEAERGGEDYLSVQAIRRAAENWAGRSGRPEDAYARNHLRKLLAAKAGSEWIAEADKVIAELRTRVEKPGQKPTAVTSDLVLALQVEPASAGAEAPPIPEGVKLHSYALDTHFLAVLLHKRNKFTAAEACYQSALRAYSENYKANPKARPLHALCQVDYGVLCLGSLHRYGDAERLFQEARRLPGCPVPFEVYTLYREAEAHRRQGRFGRSDDALDDALSKMTVAHQQKTTPLYPAVLKQHGWAYMEACRFSLAQKKFTESQGLFEKREDFQSRIEAFHCQHGLAMIERFHGRDDEAVKQLRLLSTKIAKTIDELDASRTGVPNYTELRQLLFERYVNSLGRQADCRLFSRRPDPVDAADDYRRAALLVSLAPADRRDEMRLELEYRRVTALALPFRHGTGPAAPHDLALATDLFQKAELERSAFTESRKQVAIPTRIELLRATAAFLVAPEAERAAEGKKFRALLASHHPNPRYSGDETRAATPDRDELERLMFGYRVLMDNADLWKLSRFEVLECGEQLLSLCRAATLPAHLAGQIDYAFLKYLRHDFDAVFLLKARQTPVPVKELIEIAWEATRGKPYVKPAEINPTLVFYRADGKTHALIDMPATSNQPAVCHCFPLAEEWSDWEVLQTATVGTPLLLPEDLRKALAAIKYPELRERLHKERKLRWEVRWRDPVLKLGYTPPGSLSAGYSPSALPSGEQLPFRLSDAIPADRYDDKAERQLLVGEPPQAKHPGIVSGLLKSKPGGDQIPPPLPPVPTMPMMP